MKQSKCLVTVFVIMCVWVALYGSERAFYAQEIAVDTITVIIPDTSSFYSVEDTAKQDTVKKGILPQDTIKADTLYQRDSLMPFLEKGLDVKSKGVMMKFAMDTTMAEQLTIKEKKVVKIYDKMPYPEEAPFINMGTPQRTVLKNGLTVILYEDHSMPVVTFYLGLNTANKVFEKNKKGIAEMTSRLLLSGVQNRTKDQIVDSLAAMGSMYRMTPNSFYVSCLSKYATANMNLFADVILRPSFPLQEYYAVKNAMIEDCSIAEKDASQVRDRVYRALTFGSKTPSGEMITPATVKAITSDDCVQYYNTYWRANNAVLLVMGDITPSKLNSLVNTRFRTWVRGEIPATKIGVANDVTATEVDFLHTPSSAYADILISNVADFGYDSPDVFPAIFINHIFGGDLFDNIRSRLYASDMKKEEPFSLYPDVGGGYMRMNVRTENANVVRTLAEKTSMLQKVRTQPRSSDELSKIKSYLIGKIALLFENRNTMGAFGVAIENGTIKQNFLQEVLRQINEVTPDDIMRVAQKYIKPSQFRIVIQGDATQLVPPLELSGYEVRFYDNYAVRTTRPSLSSAVPEGVTVETVLKKYFAAMGGESKMKDVKSIKQSYKISIGDKTLDAQTMARLPFYHQEQLLYDGVVYMKKTFNGNMGYTKVERTRTDVKAADVEKQRLDRSIYPLLDYSKEDFKTELDSIVPIRGYFTYKIRVTMPSGAINNYYISVDDFLPLRIENVAALAVKTMDEKTGKVTKYTPEKISSYTDFYNYKTYEGLKYPYTTEVKDDNGRIIWQLTGIQTNTSIPTKYFR
ncbi:MAG: pitrilysin family protein [Flavobacteriales bacterium]|nr:pitrilysin family protein [Flavobacteriales bacterium]